MGFSSLAMKQPASLPHAEKPARNGIAEPVPNLGGAILVRYAGPTDSRGSRWIATIERGADFKLRAVRPFNYGDDSSNGADDAARAVLSKFAAWANKNNTGPALEYKIVGYGHLNADGRIFIFRNA